MDQSGDRTGDDELDGSSDSVFAGTNVLAVSAYNAAGNPSTAVLSVTRR